MDMSLLQVRLLANVLQNPVVPFPGKGGRNPPANVPEEEVVDSEERPRSPWTGEAAPTKFEHVQPTSPVVNRIIQHRGW